RRRHTRFSRDWSSDVCSSDLSLSAKISMSEQSPPAPPLLTSGVFTILDFKHKCPLHNSYHFNRASHGLGRSVIGVVSCVVIAVRSEERRVGKGSRSRW